MEMRKTCSNGVEVIARTNPALHGFYLTVWLGMGSCFEPAGEHGITHLLEHCLIRSMRDNFDGDCASLHSSWGVYINGLTTEKALYLDIFGLASGIPFAAEMLRRLFLPIRLKAADFRAEKQRVLAEMVWSERSPYDLFADKMIWGDSPVRRSVLGTAAQVKRISRNRLNAYLQTILVPGNVRICVTGGIDENAMELLLDAAEAIPMFPGDPAPRSIPMPEYFGKRQHTASTRSGYNYLRCVFDLRPDLHSWAAIELLFTLLFEGNDALVHQELSVRSGLIYTYNASVCKYPNGGIMEVGMNYTMENLKDIMERMDRVTSRAEEGDFDLEPKKKALQASWTLVQDNPTELSSWMGGNMYLMGTPDPSDWSSVTREEVMACAKTVLNSGVLIFYHKEPWEEVEKILRAETKSQENETEERTGQ